MLHLVNKLTLIPYVPGDLPTIPLFPPELLRLCGLCAFTLLPPPVPPCAAISLLFTVSQLFRSIFNIIFAEYYFNLFEYLKSAI